MRSSLVKLVRRFLFLAALALTLLATPPAFASYTEYRSSDQHGNTYWLTCGTSAGDSFFMCPAQGGLCEDRGSLGAHQACIDAGYYPAEAN
jgi:hypothetical protein